MAVPDVPIPLHALNRLRNLLTHPNDQIVPCGGLQREYCSGEQAPRTSATCAGRQLLYDTGQITKKRTYV